MPVVVGAGLVGKVVRVSDKRSVISLITDPTFAVGVSVVGEALRPTACRSPASRRGRGAGASSARRSTPGHR